jgi:hypothetical protein
MNETTEILTNAIKGEFESHNVRITELENTIENIKESLRGFSQRNSEQNDNNHDVAEALFMHNQRLNELEKATYEQLKELNANLGKLKTPTDDFWEQRRYEIAKETVWLWITNRMAPSYEHAVDNALELADILVNKLRGTDQC